MFQTISMKQLESMLDGEQYFTLLDVRGRTEFVRAHLDGAVNLPLQELDDGYASVIPRDRPVVVYCAYGGQSMLASRKLDQMGYQVINTSGGLYYYRGNHLNGQ